MGKQLCSKLYKTLLSIIAFTGVLERAGVFTGVLKVHTVFSFTSLSNIYIGLLLLASVYVLQHHGGEMPKVLSRFRSIGVMMMLMVGIVYHFILLPQKYLDNANYMVFTYGNIAAHYLVPCGVFIDWLLFDPKGRISRFEPLVFSLLPLAYFGVASIYSYFGSNITGKEISYVYFFMDWGKLGVTGVMSWVFFILAGILCLSYLIYFIDYILGKKANKV